MMNVSVISRCVLSVVASTIACPCHAQLTLGTYRVLDVRHLRDENGQNNVELEDSKTVVGLAFDVSSEDLVFLTDDAGVVRYNVAQDYVADQFELWEPSLYRTSVLTYVSQDTGSDSWWITEFKSRGGGEDPPPAQVTLHETDGVGNVERSIDVSSALAPLGILRPYGQFTDPNGKVYYHGTHYFVELTVDDPVVSAGEVQFFSEGVAGVSFDSYSGNMIYKTFGGDLVETTWPMLEEVNRVNIREIERELTLNRFDSYWRFMAFSNDGAKVFFSTGDSRYIYEFELSRSARGDFDENGMLDAGDINMLTEGLLGGTNDLAFDLTGDEIVSDADRVEWVERVFGTAFGDANLDRVVDDLDLEVWRSHRFSYGGGWAHADFNGDGLTDGVDFNLWLQYRGFSAASAVVPEPIGLAAFLPVAFAAFSSRRWRNQSRLASLRLCVSPFFCTGM